MEIHLTPEQQTEIARLATEYGQDPETYTHQILDRQLAADAEFIAAVRCGEEQLDRGEYLTHEEVGKMIESWFPGRARS